MSNDSTRRTATRRDALRWLTTGATVALAGCGTPSSDVESTTTDPPPSTTAAQTTGQHSAVSSLNGLDQSSFSTFLDVGDLDQVADAARSITPILADRVTDDTLVYLPKGRYLMDATWNFDNLQNVAVVGDDATIEVPPGYDRNLFSPGPENTSRFHLEGVTFDFRHENTGGRIFHAKVTDDLLVRDVTVRGQLDVQQNLCRIDVTDPEGSALVERLVLPDGAAAGTGASGCLVGGSNRGDVRFQDCHIEGFPDNALYASPDEGTIEVFGGTYANSGISNVRIRGDSHVRGVHVRCDRAPEEFPNMRGIRIRGGSDVLVEDCIVELLDATYSDGAITVAAWAGGATIRNTSVRTDAANVAGLQAKPTTRSADEDGTLTIENVTFSGSARDRAAIEITDRDGVDLRNVCIRERGARRNGVELDGAGDVRFENVYVDVPGTPVVADDSTYSTSNLRIAGEETDSEEETSSDDPPGFC